MGSVNSIKLIDNVIGNFLCFILSLFLRKREIDTEKSKKILFIQLWGIGETILTLPAIAAIKNKFKDSDIYVLATDRNKEVYLSADFNVNVLTVKMNPFSIIRLMIYSFRKFDIVIDLEEYLNISSLISLFLGKQRVGFSHRIRSRLYNKRVKYNDEQHCTETFLDLVKSMGAYYDKEELVKLKCEKKEEDNVDNILNKKGKKIGIVPGAAESAKSRMWPKERYVELCNDLIKKGFVLVFIGSEAEKELNSGIINKLDSNKIIDTTGKISLKELFCLIGKVNLLVTNDTGPLHIASAQGTKTVGLFGPNTPVRFGPYGKDSIAIYKVESCEFSPCINVHKGQVPDCLYSKKSKDYQKCMKAIKVEEVSKAVEKLI